MLPRDWRIAEPSEFSDVLKSGSKGVNRQLVTVIAVPEPGAAVYCTHPRLGLIVSKRALPRAVDRNRVKRQLRHIFRECRHELPESACVVVRVLPGCKDQSSDQLTRAFMDAVSKAKRKLVQ